MISALRNIVNKELTGFFSYPLHFGFCFVYFLTNSCLTSPPIFMNSHCQSKNSLWLMPGSKSRLRLKRSRADLKGCYQKAWIVHDLWAYIWVHQVQFSKLYGLDGELILLKTILSQAISFLFSGNFFGLQVFICHHHKMWGCNLYYSSTILHSANNLRE